MRRCERGRARILAGGMLWCAVLLLAAAPAAAQSDVSPWVQAHYVRTDHMVPMRDGVRLYTRVYAPRDTTRVYPVLLTRTPYSTDLLLDPIGPGEEYARRGYVFVFQDVRGRFLSEGEFVTVRPHIPDKRPGQIDESTDTWDTVDWIVKNVPRNNGRVGQYGISYLGFYSTHGLLDAHPALKAVSPQAPVTDWFVGDDFHHNGAFFLQDAFGFFNASGVPRPEPTTERQPGFRYPTPDAYRFFLDAGPLRDLSARYFPEGRVPFWDEMMRHGTYDAWWRERSPLPHLTDVDPAVLVMGGWYDAEDVWGTLATYRAIETQDPDADNVLVMGPWWHAQWFLEDGRYFGDHDFGYATAEYYHQNIELPFFEHHLRGAPDPELPEASLFDGGTRRWRSFDSWPPARATSRALWLAADGGLTWQRPPAGAGDAAFDEYVSDPASPVPYAEGITNDRSAEYMVADQRFAATRPDVLVYRTEPLAEEVTVAGPIVADLWVSTTGTDADWVVKLIDVYPDGTPAPPPSPDGTPMGGYQRLVRGEIMRGKFRDSLSEPQPFEPGRVTRVRFELPGLLHTFQRGHRIMVQVQSSWFPLVDRNPQTFTDIYTAGPEAFRKATHRVYVGGERGSKVELTVLP